MRKTSESSSKADQPRRSPTYNVSKVKIFVRCERQYWFRYATPRRLFDTEGELHPKRPGAGLKKGGWMHKLMQAHWLETAGIGDGWQAKNEELAVEYNKMFEEEKDHYGDLPTECARLMSRYLRYYKDDDERFKIARLPNGKPAVEFVIEMPLAKWGINGVFKGQIDLLVKDLEYGGFWIRDAKWVKTIPGQDERMMSPQNIMYVAAMRKMGWDLRGFIYDYGRTKTPTEPYVLQSGMVTTRKNIDTDVATYLLTIKRTHGKHWKKYARTVYRDKIEELRARETLWFDRTRIPVEGPRVRNGFVEFIRGAKQIEGRGAPIRNYLYNCKFNCDYHDPCVAQFQGLDIEQLLKTQYTIEPERYTLEEVN